MKKKVCFLCLVLVILLGCGCGSKKNSISEMEERVISEVEEIGINEVVEVEMSESNIKNNPIQASDELSNDIRSFQVQIDNNFYEFPITYKEFVESGWQINEEYESKEGKIEAGWDEIVIFVNQGVQIHCYLYNPDVSIQPYENCLIIGCRIDAKYDAKNAAIFIPGKIQLGVSKVSDVVNIIGEPDRKYENESKTYTYETPDNWSNIELRFDENDILQEYSLENYSVPEDFVYSEAIENVEVNYSEPTELGTTIEDRIVNFDGDLYRLPAPLSAFLDNGWTTESTEETVAAGSFISLDLVKGDMKWRAYVYNYRDYACTVKDAFVERLCSSDVWKSANSFEVSGGLHMEMTEEELLAILEEGKYQYEIDSYGVYVIKLSGVEWNDKCGVAFEDGKVSYISISSSEK